MSDYVDTVDIGGTQYDIQDTETKQTADKNKQDIEALQGATDYSTTEHLTGRKWVDGKNTYELTVANFTGVNNNIKIVATLPSRIDTLCKSSGSRRTVAGQSVFFAPLPYVHDQSKNSDVGFDIEGVNLRILSRGIDTSQAIFNLTLEYTKAD